MSLQKAVLDRKYAFSKANASLPDGQGKQIVIKEAEKLNLAKNHFYFTLPGELYTDMDNKKAKFSESHFACKNTNRLTDHSKEN